MTDQGGACEPQLLWDSCNIALGWVAIKCFEDRSLWDISIPQSVQCAAEG
jgi:hypothetical protein